MNWQRTPHRFWVTTPRKRSALSAEAYRDGAGDAVHLERELLADTYLPFSEGIRPVRLDPYCRRYSSNNATIISRRPSSA
jgi:hypothetical protein